MRKSCCVIKVTKITGNIAILDYPSSHTIYAYRMKKDPMFPVTTAPILTYVVESKIFRPDIQKPRETENAVRDI